MYAIDDGKEMKVTKSVLLKPSLPINGSVAKDAELDSL